MTLGMPLALDRMEIESVGGDPKRLARAVLAQLPDIAGPVPIEAIARALDIEEIVVCDLRGVEGCLHTDALKSRGQIVVNERSRPRRRRFTVAHELGHFLNEGHRPRGQGFFCKAEDMANPVGQSIHARQEREANTFAIVRRHGKLALWRHEDLDPSLS